MRIILFHSSLCPALNCFSESGSPSTPKTATELRLQFWAAASKEWWNKKTQGELNHLPWKSYFPLKKIINLMFHNQKKNKEILFEKKTKQHRIYVIPVPGTGGLLPCPREADPHSFPRNLRKNRSLGNKKTYGAFFGRNPRGYISWMKGRKIFDNMQVFFFQPLGSFREIFFCGLNVDERRGLPAKKKDFSRFCCVSKLVGCHVLFEINLVLRR